MLRTKYTMSDFKGRALTDFIKLQLMKYYRFDRQFTLVVSECINNADITALSQTSLVEVEVKISKEDFLKEFDGKSYVKRVKHQRYNSGRKYSKYVVPNYFYFCTTKELAPFIKNYLKEHGYDNYGVLVCCEKRLFNKRSHIETYKQAKKLHKNRVNSSVFEKVHKRLQSELITLKEKVLLSN